MKNVISAASAFLLLIAVAFAGDGDKTGNKLPESKSPHTTSQYRGLLFNSTSSADAIVNDLGNGTVVVSTTTSTPQSGDQFVLISPYLVVNPNGSVFIPNDGNTYWVVPFDPSMQPLRAAALSSVSVACGCLSSPLGPANNSGCTMTCSGNTATCTGNCTDGDGNGGSCGILPSCTGGSLPPSSYMVIRANTLVLNNIQYQ